MSSVVYKKGNFHKYFNDNYIGDSKPCFCGRCFTFDSYCDYYYNDNDPYWENKNYWYDSDSDSDSDSELDYYFPV